MTASTAKSSKITNDFDTQPRTIEVSGKNGGLLKVSTDTVEVATTSLDDTGDVTLMLPLDSNTRLHSLKIYNDDLDSGGTSGAVKLGIFNGPDAFTDVTSGTHYAPYAVISAAALLAANTCLTAANTTGLETRYSVRDIAKAGEHLFEMAGLTTDPIRKLTLGLTVTTVMTTPVAGTVTMTAVHSD